MPVAQEGAYLTFLSELSDALWELAQRDSEAARIRLESTQYLKSLRAAIRSLEGLAVRDPFNKQADERRYYDNLVAETTTDVDQELLPRLRLLEQSLRDSPDRPCLADRIADAIRRAPRLEVDAPEPAATRVEPPTPTSVPEAQVARGLRVLGKLDADSIRGLAQAYGADFRAARERLERLDVYKSLHGQLHRLRVQEYAYLEAADANFQGGAVGLGILQIYEQNIGQIVTRSRQIVTGRELAASETKWIDELATAQLDLRACIAAADPALLHRVVWRMGRLLATSPEAINTGLRNVARELGDPLGRLEQALSAMHVFLAGRRESALQSTELEAAATALCGVRTQLTLLVSEHDAWQLLDTDCRRVESALRSDLTEFAFSWPDLSAALLKLIDGASTWGREARDTVTKVAAAASTGDVAAVRAPFMYLWRQVTFRFYEVDEELWALCGRLQRLDGPLASIVALLEWSVGGDAHD